MLSAQTILSFLEFPKIGRKTVWKLIGLADQEGLSDRDLEELSGFRDFIAQASETIPRVRVPDKIETKNSIDKAANILEDLNSYNDMQDGFRVEIIGYCDKEYPPRFKDLKEDAPVVFFYRGNRAALNPDRSIAVIGTREPSEEGAEAARRIGERLAKEHIVVVSGLALGCDTAAHQGCIGVGGNGVAILAHGLDRVHPASNRGLADELLENGGCLVSEYRIGEENRPYNYVQRDRLQSGLSDVVLVIETGEKGGTWNTVGFCREQGRKLACLESLDPERKALDSYKGNKKLLGEEGTIVVKEDGLALDEVIANAGRFARESGTDGGADSVYRQGSLPL